MKISFKNCLAALAALAVTSAALAGPGGPSATFSYSDGSGAPNAGSYTPGSSFIFSITLNFTAGGSIANLDGLSYWFEQQNPSAPFYFAITLRDATGSQFNQLQTPGLSYPQAMTPQSSSDLGAFLQSATGIGNGSYFIANITVSIAPSAAPGVYQIENTTSPAGKISLISDDQGHTLAIPQAGYTITVVPEPATMSFVVTGALAAIMLTVLRRRK